MEADLGDLCLSLQETYRRSRMNNLDYNGRVDHLLVHGVCHLMGFDHDTEAAQGIMEAKEDEVLLQLPPGDYKSLE